MLPYQRTEYHGGRLKKKSAALLPNTRLLRMREIASAPFPYDLIAAPCGDALAWIYNERGARNVWIARPGRNGRYSARRLTRYVDDDGKNISGLAWSGEGRTLFYVRGGVWWDGELPVNPMSLREGPRGGEIWAISAAGGNPWRSAEGSSPAPSPKGGALVFLRRGQAWVAARRGRAQPAALFIDRGRVGSMTWSPDGSRLAFVSERGTHSIVGVYDFALKSVQWISPGIDHDRDPIWSPDGERIAFIRTASEPRVPFTSHRECTPWEIWVADAADGRGRRIWRAREGVGSCFRLLFNSRKSLFWATGDRLVFPWEVTGWVRLYGVSAMGGEPDLLTPGRSEVFGASLNAERTSLVYSSNEGDLDRRHLWELSVASGRVRQLSAGDGIEDMPVISASGRILALHAQARSPLRPVEVTAAGMADIAPRTVSENFPASELIVPQLVSFPAADGTQIHGQLFVPRGRVARGPAVLFFHGGPTERQMFAAWDPFETHAHLYEANQYLANHGYVVLSVNYRGGAGYGLDYREPHGYGAGGASELEDIIAAVSYIRSRSEVDPNRLGVWGGSYGGRMALLALSRVPQCFAAGVSYAGIYNWLTMPQFELSGDPSGHRAIENLAHGSGAVAHLDGWRAPVLLILGDADPIVNVEQTRDLAAALRRKGVPVEILAIPDEVHFLLRASSWDKVFTATREYLDQRLK